MTQTFKAARAAFPARNRKIWPGFAAAEGTLAIVAVVWLAIASGIWNTDASDATERARDAAQSEQDAAALAVLPAREYMIGAYGGMPYTYDSDVKVTREGVHDFTAKDVKWKGEPFIDPIYYGVRVQRWFEGGYTGAMIDFTHSKSIALLQEKIEFEGLINGAAAPNKARLRKFFRRLEFSHGHNMLTLNGLMRLSNLHPRLSPYLGGGFGINLPHSEIQLRTDKTRTYEYQYTGPAFQGLAGLELRLARVSLFFEYKFTFAIYDAPITGLNGTVIGLFADLYRQAARWWSGEPPPGGNASTNLVSHQLISGVGVRFAPAAANTSAP